MKTRWELVIIFGFIVFFLFLANNVSAKFICDEKTKGGGIKYYECQGGATIKEIFGTEYTQGQNATMFIQVLDNDNQPFNSSLLCELRVWYPNKTLFADVGMALLTGSNNTIFYRDFNPVPNATGVYIASADCSVPVIANKTREFLKQNATFPSYLEQGNNSVATTVSIMLNVDPEIFTCTPPTLFQEEGNYTRYSYVEQVNSTTNWDKTGVTSTSTDLRMRVYKQNINTLQSEIVAINTVFGISLSSLAITNVNFTTNPMIFIDPNTERIAVDYCGRRTGLGGNININLYFNGSTSTTNSSILKTTLEKNVSIDFQSLKGAGEFHVSAPLVVDFNALLNGFLKLLCHPLNTGQYYCRSI